MYYGRDSRNPYGAKGGYVRDYRSDYASRYGDREPYDRYGDSAYSRYDNARGRRDYESDMEYRDSRYFDMRMDRHYEEEYLSDHEIKAWSKRLMEEVEDKDKAFFKPENIEKRAKELGIRYDKFTPDELYVTVLMIYTDYHKTLGTANFDMYVKLAKDWLCDEDVAHQYSHKLRAYYEHIVNGF